MRGPVMTSCAVAERLERLGFLVRIEERPSPGAFAPGVWIDHGTLCVVPALAAPGDVFHEAGHLAIIPSVFRGLIEPGSVERSCALTQAFSAYFYSEEAARLGPDHWLMRAILQASEPEAIAWSYAAAVEIGFPSRDVFTFSYPDVPLGRQPFSGNGEEVWHQVRTGRHLGVHGLHHSGMCNRRRWPKMLKWIQD